MEYLGGDKSVNKIQPVVSVCIVTYNHAPYIAECLEGVLMQETDFPFEIIVGEDESTDDTRRICIEYAEQHPDKIRLFLRSEAEKIYINGQKTGRFNFVENLKAARGEFIAMCDGDDYWTDKNKLQQQLTFLQENPEYALHYFPAKIDEHITSHGEHAETTFNFRDSLTKGKFGPTVNAFFRSAAVKNIDLYKVLENVRIGDWSLECLCTRIGLGYVNKKTTSVYRIHPGNETQKIKQAANQKFLTRLMFLRNLINLNIEMGDESASKIFKHYRYLFHKHLKKRTIFDDPQKIMTIKAYLKSFFK